MRKIHCECDNPFDNILIYISDYMCPFAYKYGFTPNILTTISLLFCVIAGLFILKSYYYLGAFFFLISYYFDCMDGHFARKYNMVTVFGDYYDHIADLSKLFLILFILYYNDYKKFYKILPPLILFLFLASIHIGCQELYYIKKESNTLQSLTNLCPVNNKNDKHEIENVLYYTRYFGCGTFILFIILIIIYYSIDK